MNSELMTMTLRILASSRSWATLDKTKRHSLPWTLHQMEKWSLAAHNLETFISLLMTLARMTMK